MSNIQLSSSLFISLGHLHAYVCIFFLCTERFVELLVIVIFTLKIEYNAFSGLQEQYDDRTKCEVCRGLQDVPKA